ncbi:MAG: complex I subunit 5 family protein [Clostridia bacterium]
MLISIIIPLITAIIIGLLVKLNKDHWLFISFTALLVNIAILVNSLLKQSLPQLHRMGQWDSSIGITLEFTQWGVIFLISFNIIVAIALIYARSYSELMKPKFFLFILLLLFSASSWVVTQDIFNMYVFLEITSVLAYALVAFKDSKYCIEAAIKYLLTGSVGGVLILSSILIVYFNTGHLNINLAMAEFSNADLTTQFIFWALIITGSLAKAGAVPMHFWLPDVYMSATTPVNVLSSGIIIKLNILTLYKLFNASQLNIELLHSLNIIMLSIGFITILFGHFAAHQQTDLRRMIAYSTVAQIGYIIISLFYGTSGYIGSFAHIIAHTFLKALLFLAVGIMGGRSISEVRGLGRVAKIPAIAFTIGAIGLIGIPPYSAFSSKWLIMRSLLEFNLLLPALVIPLGTVIATIYYLKVIISLWSKKELVSTPKRDIFAHKAIYITIFMVILTSELVPYLQSVSSGGI